MNNLILRETIKKSGLTHWQVALQMGISESTLTRMLRKELTYEQKAIVLQAIHELEEKANEDDAISRVL